YSQPVQTYQEVYAQPAQPVQQPVVQQQQQPVQVQLAQQDSRDIFAPRRAVAAAPAAHVETVEDRSDFDRFMNDRNAYNAQQTNNNEDAVTHNNQAEEPKQPSRLIQSIRDAANRYETAGRPQQTVVTNKVESETNNRAKSIAEKLGFINFDEDEFDTPSYLRKEEKTEQVKPAVRDFKNIDL
ncbi:MAG: hypothetical protein PHY93_18065, partial [Bacteriovorax sp.]|nr:hypothetical protein [Bacteriovorax sp.]